MAEQFQPLKGLQRNQFGFNYNRTQYPLMTSYQYNNPYSNNQSTNGDLYTGNICTDISRANYYYTDKNVSSGPPSSTVYPKQRYAPYQSRYMGGQQNQQHLESSSNTISSGISSSNNLFLNYNTNNCNSNQNQYDFTTYCSSADLVTKGFEYNFFQSSLNRLNGNSNTATNCKNNNTASSNLLQYGSNSNLSTISNTSNSTTNLNSTVISNYGSDSSSNCDDNQTVTLLIGNLGGSYEESALRYNILQQLKPITPVISINVEGSNAVRVKVPSKQFAKLVVSHLHRKKFGHKRMVVSYIRNSSTSEFATLRCQVAGLLKDVPFYTLSMNTFRELFQARFKQSINVVDLFRMQDICIINFNEEKEKIISLHPDLVNSIKNNNPLVECLELSVPYCTIHFKKEKHKGWAEQDIEPLPNVVMSLNELKQILLTILNIHKGDIPILSIMHCIEAELNIKIQSNDAGVNLEHLISCVSECQITNNQFGIKVLRTVQTDSNNNNNNNSGSGSGNYNKENYNDPLHHISHEIVELIKLSPKATLKFDKFIPAYHNHFGKQCRVADYGYTKLIDLFEALSSVVQVIGDGENRLITLTHRTQLRRFTNDLLRILKTQTNRSILFSKLPLVFSQFQSRMFDVSDYGVCDLVDILDGLVHNNTVITTVCNNHDILISIPKRQQTPAEIEKTSIFAEEVIELLKNAPQYSILFQKFVRSYHYNFGYQCRLSDYGFYKLSDLMESINGIIEVDANTDENRRVYLSPKVAQRVFSEQIFELTTGSSNVNKECVTKRPKMKLSHVLEAHKDKYGYQIQSHNLGYRSMIDAIKALPYIELVEMHNDVWVICHHEDPLFRTNCYAASTVIVRFNRDCMPFAEFRHHYPVQPTDLIRNSITSMNYFIELKYCPILKDELIKLTPLMKFLLEIINFINSRKTAKLNEIKNELHIQVGSCFEYGFPNLSALICGFSDIFIVNDKEMSNFEIKLNPDNFLTTWINSQPNHSFNFIGEDSSYQNSSDSLLNFSKSSASFERSFIDLNNNFSESYLKENKAELLAQTTSLAGNEIDFSKGADQVNTSSVSSTKIYKRRHISKDYELNLSKKAKTSSNVKFCDALDYARLLSAFYEPPKPDTPPSIMIPFWLDPVWSYEKPWSPDINESNISKIIDGAL